MLAGRELGGHRRQPLLEELEQRGRDVGAGRGAPLGRGGARQPEHLLGDAVEELRVPLLVAALEEEDPGHQALLGGQLRLPGRVGERRQLLGDGVLGDAEAGEQRRQALATLGRQLRPRATSGVRSMAAGFHCRRATTCEKKLGQNLRFGAGRSGRATTRSPTAAGHPYFQP